MQIQNTKTKESYVNSSDLIKENVKYFNEVHQRTMQLEMISKNSG